jgi:hypothetical protein
MENAVGYMKLKGKAEGIPGSLGFRSWSELSWPQSEPMVNILNMARIKIVDGENWKCKLTQVGHGSDRRMELVPVTDLGTEGGGNKRVLYLRERRLAGCGLAPKSGGI